MITENDNSKQEASSTALAGSEIPGQKPMNSQKTLSAERGADSVQRMVRRFRDLPLGTRFKYIGGEDVWVVLKRHGFGLVAKWEGVDGPTWGQSICSLTETEAECETLEVIVAESPNAPDQRPATK